MGAGFIAEMNQVLSLGELKSIDLRREFISMDQNLFSLKSDQWQICYAWSGPHILITINQLSGVFGCSFSVRK